MRKIYMMLIALCLASLLNGQISTTVTMNAVPIAGSPFATFSSAITAVNGLTITGPVVVNATAGQTETLTNKITLTATGTSTNTIIIQKNGGGANPKLISYTGTIATPAITADGFFVLAGSDYVTIDGIDLEEAATNTTTTTVMEFGYALAKSSATDGAQNNTIQNCTITLNRVQNTAWTAPGHNGSCGIVVLNTTNTTSSALTVTAASGSNSNNRFYANTIQNCNAGIVLVGFAASVGVGPNPNPTTFFGDLNNDVGGTATGTGNTILNFGGGSASNPATGIFGNQQWSFNCSYNTIDNNNGSGINHATTLRGIFLNSSSTSASANCNNNTITIRSGAATSALNAIENSFGATAAGNTININNNTIRFSYTTATTGIFSAIVNTTSAATVNINNNNIQQLASTNYPTTSTIPVIVGGSPGGPLNINNNIISNFVMTGASGTLRAITASTPIGLYTATGNTIENLSYTTATSTGSIDGIYNLASATSQNWSNNIIRNLSTPTTGTLRGIQNNTVAGTFIFNNNQIYNFFTSAGGAGGASMTGISSLNNNATISGNIIYSLNSTGSTGGTGGSINGIITSGTGTSIVTRNAIYDLSSTSTNCVINGINITGGTTNNVNNNLIGDLRAPNSTGNIAISGMLVGGGTTNNLFHNTINIASTTNSVSTFGSSAIYFSSSTPTNNLRNNVFVNTSNPGPTGGFTAAIRYTIAPTNSNFPATNNNNFYYAGTPAANRVIYCEGATATPTNGQQTIANYKTYINTTLPVAGREGVSVSEIPNWTSTTGSNPITNFLQYNTGTASQIEQGGGLGTGITNDFAGTARCPSGGCPGGVSTPDMGAWELNGIPSDLTGPLINYTIIGNTSCLNDIVLSPVNISDASGVNNAAGLRPRLYYKKSTNANTYVDNTNATDGWKYVEATGTGGNPYSFTTDYALLFGGTPVNGDSISYFVVAQDLASIPNVGINAGTFATATSSVALTASAFPLSGTINGYRIVSAGLIGTVTVGATGTYPNLTGATGLFNAINTQGMSGSLTANIIDATITEPGTVALNAINYNGCTVGTYPLLIKPDAGVNTVLTGSIGTGAVIKLNGADFVTFDGSNNGSSSRNMTIQNTTTTTTGNAVIWLAAPASGNGSNNDTIKNCIIQGNSATTSFTGIHVGGNTTIGITTAGNERNNNNAITNNLFRRTQYGLTMFGIATILPDLNNIVNNNNFGTAVAGEGFSLLAINADRQQNLVVSGNEVQNVNNATNVSSTPFGGIRLLDFKDGLCYNNNVHDLSYTNTSTSKIYGIAITSSSYTTAGNPSNALIYNNMVSRITSTATSAVWNTTGILASAGYGDRYYYNTVNLNGQLANSSSGLAAAFANGDGNITSVCTNIDVRNNIFSITGSSGASGGNFWSYYSTASTIAGSVFNNNNLFCNSTGVTNNVGRFNSVNYATLAAWQAATSQEANSVSIAPIFVSNSDAHLVPGSNATLDNLGTPIAGITDDIDGEARSATTPDMGADEFTAPVCITAVGGTASGNTASCVSYTGNITATGYSIGLGSTYQWLSAPSTSGPWTAIGGATNPASYTISPAVTVTTYYKLAVACATNTSVDSSTVVTVTINPRPTVPVTPAGPITICAPATQTIDGSGTNAASPVGFQWLNNNAVISGANSATYVASTSGSYRVRVVDGVTGCFDTSLAVIVSVNAQPEAVTVAPTSSTICSGSIQQLTASGGNLIDNVQLGSGNSITIPSTTSSTLGPNPLQSFYGGAKQQMIVLASELTSLGLSNGSSISAIAFQMSAVEARVLQNYQVKISNTALSAFASNTFEPAGTVVRNPANFTPIVGWNTITFNTNYIWNGTSNLLIEVNFSNNDAGGTGTNTAFYHTTSGATSLFYRVDNNTAAAVDAATTASFAAYSQRNNMRFTYTSPTAITWSPLFGLYSDAAATISYTGSPATSVYVKTVTTNTYTATATSAAGCTNTGTATVTTTGVIGTTPISITADENTYAVSGATPYMVNCRIIAEVTPTGATPVGGNILARTTLVTPATNVINNEPYGPRVVDLDPSVDGTGAVKLYFTQQDLTDYNTYLTTNSIAYEPVAANPTDPAAANVRIRQWHGPAAGTGPGTGTDLLVPTSIIWDPAGNNGIGWWVVTVNAPRFSSFFLTSPPIITPVNFANLRGELTGTTNTVYWTTTSEQNNRKFLVERSLDARNFTVIGEVASRAINGNSSIPLSYSFVDANPVQGKQYYRLQMVDMGGRTTQSPIVTLRRGGGKLEIVDVRPNPTTGTVYFNVLGTSTNVNVAVRDLSGKEVIRKGLVQSNSFSIDLSKLANGMYILEAVDVRNGEKAMFKVMKQ